jgi:hypothetical protein
VTPLLLGWLHGNLPNRGLGPLGSESGPDAYRFIFDSRTGAFPPELEIAYQLPAPTPPPPTQIPIPPHPPLVTKPLLVLSDNTATAGTQIRVTGFGYPTDLCSRYDTFLIQNSQTPVLMGSTEPSDGDFTTLVITVPVSAKGTYNVVTLGGGHQSTTHLVVTPTVVMAGPELPVAPSTASLSANPISGAPGTRVTVTGSGFTGAGCSPVNFYWQKNLATDAPQCVSVGTGYLSGGAVSYSFAVPPAFNGSAVLMAVGPNNTVASNPSPCAARRLRRPRRPTPSAAPIWAWAITTTTSNRPTTMACRWCGLT